MSAVAVPAVSTAALTINCVPASTYSYVVPLKTWLDVAPAAIDNFFLTIGIFLTPNF